jgi:uncharacterized protein YkwD
LRSTRSVLGGLLAGVLALPAAAHLPAAAASPESEMVLVVNRIRDRHGEPPLHRSIGLTDSSARFASWLMRRGSFGHRAGISVAGRFEGAGEALALHAGRRPHVRETVGRWMRSTVHRALLLSKRFAWIGVGRSWGRFGGRPSTIWVARLAGR